MFWVDDRLSGIFQLHTQEALTRLLETSNFGASIIEIYSTKINLYSMQERLVETGCNWFSSVLNI